MTLVELLVSLALLTIIMGAFFLVYFSFAGSSTNTVNYSQEQGTVRNAVRILEADLRSSDPLTVVPSSFTSAVTLPSGTVTSSGTNGTTPTDVIAMYENNDLYAACPTTTTTTTTVPSPFLSTPYSANVVWAYNSTAATLTRYSYVAANSGASSSVCKTGGWITDGVTLSHVVNSHGTMFTISQGGSALTQATTPTSTTVTNQAAAACGTSVSVQIVDKNTKQGQQFSFVVQTTVPLSNQTALQTQACG